MPLPLLGLLGGLGGKLAAGGATKLAGGLAGKAGGLLGKAGKGGELLSKGSELLQGIGGKKEEGEGEQVADNKANKKDEAKNKKKVDQAFVKAINGDRLDEKDINHLKEGGILKEALAIKAGKSLGNGPVNKLPSKA